MGGTNWVDYVLAVEKSHGVGKRAWRKLDLMEGLRVLRISGSENAAYWEMAERVL